MDSCKELFNTMDTVSFYSQYIFSLLLHVVNNKHLFTKNLEVHNHDTRSANHFLLPITNLTKYKKEIINYLPTHTKCAADEIQVFISALKRFLLSNAFHSIQEYFNSNK